VAVLPRALTRNWTLKLASLGLAIFLWAVVRADPPGRETLTEVPVRVQIGDLDWTLDGVPEPATVDVSFAGPVRQVLRLDRSGTVVRVPLPEVTNPDTVIQLRRDWVVMDGAAGLVVDDIVPATVRLALTRNVAEPRPVAVRVRGELPDELGLAAPLSTSPSVVRLRGPASRIEAVDSVPTVSLDLGRISTSGVLELPVDTGGMAGVSVSPTEVQLRVQVDTIMERYRSAVPVELPPGSGSDAVVEPERLGITLVGPRTLLMRPEASRVRLVARLGPEGVPPPGSARRVPVDVVDAPGLVRTTPSADSVTVRRPPVGEGGRP
jgi:hypothetical protein